MKVAMRDISFPSELTQLPKVLTIPEICQDGCEVLAHYIDRSVAAVRQILMFPIVVPLFRLFSENIESDWLNLAVAKILAFVPESREIITLEPKTLVKNYVIPLIEGGKTLQIVIAALLCKDNEDAIAELTRENVQKKLLPLLKHNHPDVRLWTLLLLSLFARKMPNSIA
jgi:hypothetical protein